MARLIPRIDPHEIGLKPERDVAVALVEGLPDDWVVYHSYPWLRETRNDKHAKPSLHEGEADFVVIDPKYGFLVLEIKGGEIGCDVEQRRWFRKLSGGREKDIQDPFEQARRSMHELQRQVAQRSFARDEFFPCAYGHAVVFPSCEYTGTTPPGSVDKIVLSSKDLPFLGQRIPKIMEAWARFRSSRPMDERVLHGLMQGLSSSFCLLPVLFRRIEEQEERIFRLTQGQMRLLDHLRNHAQAAIEGVAGSGKTLLACAQAQRFAAQGLNTLFLCFNRSLAEWVESTIPECFADKIWAVNFHRLCFKLCDMGKVSFQPGANQSEFWRQTAPELLSEALGKVDYRAQAVVVDEGQDFFPEWWLALDDILESGDAPYYIFYDPAQNLFVGEDFSLPMQKDSYCLSTNCRNTRAIAEACKRIGDAQIEIHEFAPPGNEIAVHEAGIGEGADLCAKVVKKWLGQGGKLQPSQIVIQCPYTRKHSSLAEVRTVAGVPLVDDVDAWRRNEGILFATIRSFKGLEADASVVIDVPAQGGRHPFSATELYVACSRAKHLLAVLGEPGCLPGK